MKRKQMSLLRRTVFKWVFNTFLCAPKAAQSTAATECRKPVRTSLTSFPFGVQRKPYTTERRRREFFSPWKSKVPVKALFCSFCDFFHGWNFIFTPTFLNIFTGSPGFSRAVFDKFSRVDFLFSRAECWEFSREGIFFHGLNFGSVLCLKPPNPNL